MSTCNNCKGCGVIRITFKCGHCVANRCYLCENVNKVLEECSACHGTGKIKITKNKITKNKFIMENATHI